MKQAIRALYANNDWQERVNTETGKRFWQVLVGPVGFDAVSAEDRQVNAYNWAINEDDQLTVEVDGAKHSVNLKSYVDEVVRSATGGINPKGVLRVLCDDIVLGKATELTYKDGSVHPQITVYPVNFVVETYQRSRPAAVKMDESAFAALKSRMSQPSRPVVVAESSDAPF